MVAHRKTRGSAYVGKATTEAEKLERQRQLFLRAFRLRARRMKEAS